MSLRRGALRLCLQRRLGLPLLAGSSYLRPKALLLASAYLGYVVWLLLPSLGG